MTATPDGLSPMLARANRRTGARSPLVGRYNRGIVLETIRLRPGTSRVEVAAATSLTTAAVSNIVRSLIDEGLVEENGVGESRGGKPRVRLQVRRQHRYALGIHLRPHSVRVAATDLDGTVVCQTAAPVPRRRADPQHVLQQAADLAERVLAKSEIDRESVLGVGIACPGPIDPVNRRVLTAPNLPHWDAAPVAALLEERLGWPVTLENNANAAAIGEKWIGAARELRSFLYLYLGIGIGGAIFFNHQLYRGASSNAAAIGHLSVDPNGPRCRCGNRGCLEAMAGERALVQYVSSQIPDARKTLELKLTPASLETDHTRIMFAASHGHRTAAKAIGPALEQLAAAVASLINVLDVGHVVVGGPAMVPSPQLYLAPIETALAQRPIARDVQHIDIIPGALGELAAVIGAASLIFHDAYSPSLTTTSERYGEAAQ